MYLLYFATVVRYYFFALLQFFQTKHKPQTTLKNTEGSQWKKTAFSTVLPQQRCDAET